MRIKNLDLIVAMLIVVINVGWTQVPNRPILLGVILALPLVFILPGYMLIQMLLCGRSKGSVVGTRAGASPAPTAPVRKEGAPVDQTGPNVLVTHGRIGASPVPTGGSNRLSHDLVGARGPASVPTAPFQSRHYVLLSIGLSIALDIVVGFVLNLFPFGIQMLSWALALGLIISVCVLLTAFLRQSSVVTTLRIPRTGRISTKILCGLALLLASAALWLSVIRPPAVQANFTQFWMLPGHTNSCTVSLGVQNFEATSVTYRVVMKTNGTQVQTWSSIVLAPQQEWKQSIAVTPTDSETLALEAQLYRADAPTKVYRDVHMTMHILKGDKNEILHC